MRERKTPILIIQIKRADGPPIPMRPPWKEAIAAYDAEVSRREAARAEHETPFADLSQNERCKLKQRQAAEYRRRLREALYVKDGYWEGPKLVVTLEHGLSHPWDGPEATRAEVPVVDRQGHVYPIYDGDVIVGMLGLLRCRGCGHLPKMPSGGLCHHCLRTGMDGHPEVRGVVPKIMDLKPRDRSKIKGGVT